MRALVLSALLVAPPAGGAAARQADGAGDGLDVRAEREGDALVCSAHAADVPLERFLDEIARATGLRVEGRTPLRRAALVTVDLERRPLAEVLEYSLGSLGLCAELDADAIRLSPAAPLGAERALELAQAAYERAQASYPDHALAPAALLSLGEIEERRGAAESALWRYQTVAERYRGSPLVAEALERSARLLEAQRAWGEASAQHARLGEIAADAELRQRALLGVARCSLELGDPVRALFVLDALEAEHAGGDGRARVERALVRARATLATGRSAEALRCLSALPTSILDGPSRARWLELLARSLEAEQLHSLAARTWLMSADASAGAARAHALEQSARLALAAGDALGALLATGQEHGADHAEELEELARDARAALDLETGDPPEDAPLSEKLATAERRIEQGRSSEAARLLGAVLADGDSGGEVEPEDELARARAERLYARAVEQTRGLDAALHRLRQRRERTFAPAARRELDLEAALLLERHEQWERAAAAYEGSY